MGQRGGTRTPQRAATAVTAARTPHPAGTAHTSSRHRYRRILEYHPTDAPTLLKRSTLTHPARKDERRAQAQAGLARKALRLRCWFTRLHGVVLLTSKFLDEQLNSGVLWGRGQLRLGEYKGGLRSLRERVGTDSRSDYLRCLACGLTPRVRLREGEWNRGRI